MRREPEKWRVIAVAILLALTAVGRVGPAQAHAVLLDAVPAADTVAETTPTAISLTFNEPVQPIFARVLDAAGNAVSRDAAVRSIDHRVEIALPEALAEGGYIVTWRVVSQDSHPVGGSHRFAVGHMPDAWRDGASFDVPGEHDFPWRIGIVLARAVFLTALLSMVGGVWFLALFSPHVDGALVCDIQRRTAALALASPIAAIGLIPVQGGLMLASGLEGLVSGAVWRAGLETPLGTSAIVAASASLVIGICLKFLSGRTVSAILAGIALLAAASVALTGHAAAAPPRALTTMAVALHAIAAAFWLGALWPLQSATRRLPALEASRLLTRFSKLAVLAVAVLIGAGFVIALIQVERPAALITTDYGRILLFKLGLVALVLLLAIQNKRRLAPALARDDEWARRHLHRNIRIEISVIVAVILVTATLGQTTPPRSIPAHDASGHHHHPSAHAEPIVVDATDPFGRRTQIAITPGRAGWNRIEARFIDATGQILVPQDTRIQVANPSLGIEPVSRPMQQVDDTARFEGSDMSLAGHWVIRIDALLTEFDKAIFEVSIRLQ